MSKDTQAKKEKDLFDDSNSPNFEYFKFSEVGDRVSGTFVGTYQSTSSMYGYEQENYVLVTEDGSNVVVSGRYARKSDGVKVIFGIERIPVGAFIGFMFTKEKDTGKGNPCKIIEIRYAGEKRPDVLKKFLDMYTLDSFKAEGETGDNSPKEQDVVDIEF